jgi:hypothetical protein
MTDELGILDTVPADADHAVAELGLRLRAERSG